MNEVLAALQQANPLVNIIDEDEVVNVKMLWSDPSFMFKFKRDADFSPLADIDLPPELVALIHKKNSCIEFIFSPLPSDKDFLKRKTKFIFNGVEIETEFAAPSKAVELLASGFTKLDSPSDTQYRNLEVFSDFYRPTEQTEKMRSYFKDKIPISFFIKGDLKEIKLELISICKYINLYLKFFDRKAPAIAILSIESNEEKFILPCRSSKNKFPDQINVTNIDPIVIDLLQVASETGNNRLRYLFYFQVLEYYAYYYLDEELKRKLGNILRNPDLISESTVYASIIIEELKDHANNTTDKQKLAKVLRDYLKIDDIILEIRSNMNSFVGDLEFDGGFKLHPLIQDEKNLDKMMSDGSSKEKKKELEKLTGDFIIAIADRIDKIRNVLVHIRENRENKVILPTRVNNKKILPYVYLVRRIAEVVAMRYH